MKKYEKILHERVKDEKGASKWKMSADAPKELKKAWKAAGKDEAKHLKKFKALDRKYEKRSGQC